MTKKHTIKGWVVNDASPRDLFKWRDNGKLGTNVIVVEKTKAGNWSPSRPVRCTITIEIEKED